MAGLGFKDFTVGEVLTSADVDGYLMQQSVMRFADSAARGSALGTAVGTGVPLAEGMVAYLDDTNTVEMYTGTAWEQVGGGLKESVYFTASGTFVKADYPWAKSAEVIVVGGGGGGGGADAGGNQAPGGGGGGAAIAFLAVSSFAASETVTVGAGGAAGAAANGAGGTGGTSSFGTAVSATGGVGGRAGSGGGAGTAGDLLLNGQPGAEAELDSSLRVGGAGGASANAYGPSSAQVSSKTSNITGSAGILYGGGGGGAVGGDGARSGGAGAAGIVIVRLFS